MPLITAMRTTFAADGVTPNGFGVTPTGGAEFVFNISNSPGATPSVIQTAVQTLAATQLPSVSLFCHCFSVIPFHVALWIGNPGTVPDNANWWLHS